MIIVIPILDFTCQRVPAFTDRGVLAARGVFFFSSFLLLTRNCGPTIRLVLPFTLSMNALVPGERSLVFFLSLSISRNVAF